MNTLNYIRLDSDKTAKIIAKLQQLLADYHVYYSNLRGYHWNVKGSGFFTLHEKLEEWYDNAADRIDEIAERILTLGDVPENRPDDYLKKARIQSVGNIACGETAATNVRADLDVLIALERELKILADNAGDEGTASMMSDYIRSQEKLVWMLTAFLSK
ncbi:MAG: DNA starvation/stationary phase protection protein [Prevotellaceae bacterium]|jgi:starvation-inducible DNA-binding protein|nr:DNA starvation/stationary phase protection protein [Prevotellaceae bacterium]